MNQQRNKIFGCIYLIQNIITKKFYVGQSIQPEVRFKQHINYPDKRTAIGRAIQKYGKNNFRFTIIDKAETQEELNLLEESYICLFGSKTSVNGYNIRNGGSNGRLPKAIYKKIGKKQQKEKNHQYLFLDENKIIDLYLNKEMSAAKIAKELETSEMTIFNRLKLHKIDIRHLRDAHKTQALFGLRGAQYSKKKQPPWTKVWVSRIKYNGNRTHLGCFNDPLSASIVYNFVNSELYGDTK